MTCKILVTKPSGNQELIATFTLDKGKVTYKAEPGELATLNRVLNAPNPIDGGRKVALFKKDPVAWFKALPSNYHGSYFRAEMSE